MQPNVQFTKRSYGTRIADGFVGYPPNVPTGRIGARPVGTFGG
jgi:hypothetical protein